MDWLSFRDHAPEGTGTILIITQAGWARTMSTEGASHRIADGVMTIDGNAYSHFAYIDHPWAIPTGHGLPSISVSVSPHGTVDGLINILRSHLDALCLAPTWGAFLEDDQYSVFLGQENSARVWMCGNGFEVVCRTEEDRDLALIAIGDPAKVLM